MAGLAMTDVLITGGLGFIGSHLALALVKKGKRVRILDNNFRGDFENLKGAKGKIDIITGGIKDLNQVRRAVKGVNTIFHLAYINGTEYFYTQPRLVLEVGIKGTLNVIDAAIANGVKNFIFASSSETYQTPITIPTPEDIALIVPDVKNPRFTYGGGKILGELLTLHYTQNVKMRRIIFRPHNIYGPKMGWEHVIPQLLKKVYDASSGFKKDKAVIAIQGSGKESRSFCYIDDAIKGILICGHKGKDGEIYNIGKEEEVSINDLIREIGNILDIKIITRNTSLRKGSTKRRCPDVSRLKSLGYKPHVFLQEGLEKTIEWYKERLSYEKTSH